MAIFSVGFTAVSLAAIAEINLGVSVAIAVLIIGVLVAREAWGQYQERQRIQRANYDRDDLDDVVEDRLRHKLSFHDKWFRNKGKLGKRSNKQDDGAPVEMPFDYNDAFKAPVTDVPDSLGDLPALYPVGYKPHNSPMRRYMMAGTHKERIARRKQQLQKGQNSGSDNKITTQRTEDSDDVRDMINLLTNWQDPSTDEADNHRSTTDMTSKAWRDRQVKNKQLPLTNTDINTVPKPENQNRPSSLIMGSKPGHRIREGFPDDYEGTHSDIDDDEVYSEALAQRASIDSDGDGEDNNNTHNAYSHKTNNKVKKNEKQEISTYDKNGNDFELFQNMWEDD